MHHSRISGENTRSLLVRFGPSFVLGYLCKVTVKVAASAAGQAGGNLGLLLLLSRGSLVFDSLFPVKTNPQPSAAWQTRVRHLAYFSSSLCIYD